jgi:hypothetical protein
LIPVGKINMSTANEHSGKVIITCAVTGAIHTPSMSPYLPVTPEEIIADSLAAAEAGEQPHLTGPY